MDLLTRAERRHLVDLLCRLPNMDDLGTRRLLVDGLPDRLKDNITFSSTLTVYIATIVDTVTDEAWQRLADGSWTLLIVLENAISLVQGAQLVNDLQALLTTLKERLAQPPQSAAAQGTAGLASASGVSAAQPQRAMPIALIGGGVVALLALLIIGVIGIPIVIQPPPTPTVPPSITKIPSVTAPPPGPGAVVPPFLTTPTPTPPKCRTQVMTMRTPFVSRYYNPRSTNGDREFESHGPWVVVRVSLTPQANRIEALLEMAAREVNAEGKTVGDGTAAQSTWSLTVYTAPAGWSIKSIIGMRPTDTWSYMDTDHDGDTGYPPAGGPVNHFFIIGDTEGDDVGDVPNVDTGVQVYFNPLQVELVQTQNCVP